LFPPGRQQKPPPGPVTLNPHSTPLPPPPTTPQSTEAWNELPRVEGQLAAETILIDHTFIRQWNFQMDMVR